MRNPFSRLRLFSKEVFGELKKVAWPSRKELKESTIVVIVAIALLGSYIGLVDFSLFQVVNLFTSWSQFGLGG